MWKFNRVDMTANAGRVAVALYLLLGPGAVPASAHAFAERYDLPLPLWYYLAGAGSAVAISFVAAGYFMRAPDERPMGPTIALTQFRLWRALTRPSVARALHMLSVALFLLIVASGFLGVQGEPLENPLPVVVWIIWWVGFTYLCALVGDAWGVVNPIAVVAGWASQLIRRRSTHSRVAWPAWAGVWPAVVLYFVFACAEMAWPENAVPKKLALAVVVYCLTTWAAMAVFGIETWSAKGDPFSHFFGLVSRFAPVDRQSQTLRAYGAGLVTTAPAATSEMAFVLLALASVSFDGLRETPAWSRLSSATISAFYRIGLLGYLGNATAGAVVKIVGLVTLPFVFAAVYLATCRWIAAMINRSDGQDRPWSGSEIARLFVLSLVPIAIAYHLAHYLSYLLVQGQAIIPLASDPFGRGWNLLGTRLYQPDLGLVGARFVWFAAVATIVAGHVAAVFVAHATALRAFRGRRAALRSQYPMLVLMVGYTTFSLWVLSQPIVESS